MSQETMTTAELINHKWFERNGLVFKCIAGHKGLGNVIGDLNINRPGLSLTGYEMDFAADRIQMFGRGESGYLRVLEDRQEHQSIETFFDHGVPCVLFSYNITPPDFFLQLCDKYNCPAIQTDRNSSTVMQLLTQFISTIQAPSQIIHAVLVEVYGFGVLLTGESGIGKSETALALIERGHLLVCDDVVRITRSSENILIGTPVEPELGHHMEIRGLGIIDIPHLFGIGVVRNHKAINLLIELAEWGSNTTYDRIGTHEQTVEFFNIGIPKLTIPVGHGRILTVIIETAVRNMRLKLSGYNAATEFTDRVRNQIAKKSKSND